jgi:hypothetical protein
MISKYEQDSAKISRLAQSSNLGQSDRAKMRQIFCARLRQIWSRLFAPGAFSYLFLFRVRRVKH